MKKRYVVLGIGLLLIGACILLNGCPQQHNNANGNQENSVSTNNLTVKVAANLPISGALAIWGSSIRDGANMAIEDLTKQDPSNPKINIDWQDNASDPKQAVSVFQKQFLNTPDIYVSGIKPQYMAIADQIAAKGIPNFVWVFDPVINAKSNNNLRSCVSYKIEPPVYLEYTKKIKAKKVAIVYVLLPHAKEEFETLVIPGLKAQGISDIMVEEFDLGTTDFKSIAVKVKNFQPDLIMLNGFQGDMVGLVRSLRTLNVVKDGNLIGTYDMMDAATVLSASEMEGIRVVAPLFQTRPEKRADWTTAFKAKYNKEPLYIHAFGYDMVQIINDAAKRVKQPVSTQNWLDAIRATNIQGVTGALKFDTAGDLITPLEVGVYHNGKLIPDNAEDSNAK